MFVCGLVAITTTRVSWISPVTSFLPDKRREHRTQTLDSDKEGLYRPTHTHTRTEHCVILAVHALPLRTPTERLASMYTSALHSHMFHCLLSLSTDLTSASVTQIHPPSYEHMHASAHTLNQTSSRAYSKRKCQGQNPQTRKSWKQHNLERFMLPFSIAVALIFPLGAPLFWLVPPSWPLSRWAL